MHPLTNFEPVFVEMYLRSGLISSPIKSPIQHPIYQLINNSQSIQAKMQASTLQEIN